MGIRDIFKPKPNKFLLLLSNQAHVMVTGLNLLKSYLEKRNPDTAKEIRSLEKEGCEIRQILTEELMRTFVTPYDREDIFALSREIDDILNYTSATIEEMKILEIKATPYMVRMAALLYDGAVELELGIQRLQDKHYKVANDHAQVVKGLENRVETVYREALAELFQGKSRYVDIMDILKAREVYRHLSNAADREDFAANVITEIIMKVS